MAVDKSSVVRFVLVLLMRLSAFATGFSSRGQMSSGVPYFAGPDHRVVLVGDFLSWDSADYKVAEALEIVGTVEDLLVLQLDEVEGDLLALQLRSFDPTIVLISVRTRAYEHLVHLVEHVARTESRRGEDVVVAVLHLQAHAIPAAQRAFARSLVLHADGEHYDDKYEDRTARYRADYDYSRDLAAMPLLLYIDGWATELEDVAAGGLLPVWLGPMVPESWCWDQQDDCDHTVCPRDNLLHDIIVLVGHDNCASVGGDDVGMSTGLGVSEACRVAAYVRERHGAARVLMLHAGNASAAREHFTSAVVAGKLNTRKENQKGQDVHITRQLLTSAKVLVITLAGSNSAVTPSFSPVQHAIEAMALGGPALVMDAPVAQTLESLDDIINGTHAHLYRAGDLLALGVALDHLLADSYDNNSDNSSSMSRCMLRQRACKDVCMRHSAVAKLVHVLDDLHDEQRLYELGLRRREEEIPAEHPAADVRSLSSLEGIGSAGTAGNHTRLLGGLDMDLGTLLPHANISFHVKVAHLSFFTEAQRSVGASVILGEDAPRFHKAVGYNTSADFVVQHEGFFVAALRGVTVVHDAVICNTTHAITAMATKHTYHPPVQEIHGCQLHDDDPVIRHVGTALLLVRYMGWFWGHFCPDLLHRLAFAVDVLDKRQEATHACSSPDSQSFQIILESRSHANVLALVQAVLGGGESGEDVNSRVLFMPTECLRGNARVCPYYFRSQELLIVEILPHLVNTIHSLDDIQDAVPPGIRLAQRRIGAFFDARLDEIERTRQSRDVMGHFWTSGAKAVRYGEAGECSQGKAHRLTVLKASGEADRGRSSRACRGLDAWFTSHLEKSRDGDRHGHLDMAVSTLRPTRLVLDSFRVVYIGRGSSPCPTGRTRCVLNAAELVDALDSVGLLFSFFNSIFERSERVGTHESVENSKYAGSVARRPQQVLPSGCVVINHEANTHTFLETVDIMRLANLVVSVQGSQNYNLLFATRGTGLIEMVPTHENHRAESNRIYLSSLGMRMAILPIYGFHLQDPRPFSVDPCRLVRLIDALINDHKLESDETLSLLEKCSQLLQMYSDESGIWTSPGPEDWCREVQYCFPSTSDGEEAGDKRE